MKRALFNPDGLPLAFYAPEISGDAMPAAAVEITDEQWQEMIDNQGRRRWVDGVVVAYDPPPGPDPVEPILFTYKVDLFRRATEDEAEQIDAALAGVSARMRRLFDGAQRLEHDAEEFLTLQAAAVQLFGQTRANQLLAPS